LYFERLGDIDPAEWRELVEQGKRRGCQMSVNIVIGLGMAVILFVAVVGPQSISSMLRPYPIDNTPMIVTILPALVTPTQLLPVITSTPRPQVTNTPEVSLLPVSTPTALQPPAITPTSISGNNIAIALQPSTIYVLPSVNSTEIGLVKVGDQVIILGRSTSGNWYYIRNDTGTAEGYVARDRFQWTGDFSALAVVTQTGWGPGTTPVVNPTLMRTPISTISASENLTLDLWSMPSTGKCLPNGTWKITVFMSGHGASGIYTYFWNGEQKSGPISDSITFDIIGNSNRILGTGRVISAKLVIEKALIINRLSCP
jgi:hypothetical protein